MQVQVYQALDEVFNLILGYIEVNYFWVHSFGMIWIRSVIRDHSDHCRSNEPMNPCPEWIHRFIWFTTIQVILDH